MNEESDMAAGGMASMGSGSGDEGRAFTHIPLPNLPPGVSPKDLIEALKFGRDPDEPIFGVDKPDPEELKGVVHDMIATGQLPRESEARMLRMVSGFNDTTMSHPRGCSECNRAGKSLCSRCGVARFCSPECQRKNWRTHKSACAAAAAVLAAPPGSVEIEYTFRVDGEDEIPIPAGYTLFAVAARVAGLVVGKITGGLIDVASVVRSGTDPAAAAATFGDENGTDLANVTRSLFTWGSAEVRDLGAGWPAAAAAGKEVALVVCMARVAPAWRRRGIGRALMAGLLGHARTARHSLAVLLEGGHEEDGRTSVPSSLFFNACGFRASPLGALPESLLLRPAAATHPARRLRAETEAEVVARFADESRLRIAVSEEKAAALRRGLKGPALRRHLAEHALTARLALGGPLAAAAYAADLASLRRKWPRAVAAAAARGLPEVHLLNIKPGRAGMSMFEDDAMNWHLVAYDADALGRLTAEAAEALGVPPHPQHRGSPMGGGACSVM